MILQKKKQKREATQGTHLAEIVGHPSVATRSLHEPIELLTKKNFIQKQAGDLLSLKFSEHRALYANVFELQGETKEKEKENAE